MELVVHDKTSTDLDDVFSSRHLHCPVTSSSKSGGVLVNHCPPGALARFVTWRATARYRHTHLEIVRICEVVVTGRKLGECCCALTFQVAVIVGIVYSTILYIATPYFISKYFTLLYNT